MRRGQKVLTPKGSGLIVGFSQKRHGWDLWGLEVYDPTHGRILMVDTTGPFIAVLIGDQVLPVRPDDVGIAPTKAVYPGLFEIAKRFMGFEREL